MTGLDDPQPRAGVRRARVRALDILMADDTLRASYLLTSGGNPSPPPLDENGASQFLLWFALEGRHQYQQVTFSPAYIAFLAAPEPPFLTRLAAYVHRRRAEGGAPHDGSVDDFHAWYYVSGVQQLRLTPLLTARERSFLMEDHSRGARRSKPMSRWDFFRFLAQREADTRGFRHAPSDERDAAAWLSENRGGNTVPWHCPPPSEDRSGLPGINVIGSADGVSGIGEDARTLTEVLLKAGVQQSVFNVRYPAEIVTTDKSGREAYFSDRPLYPINVFCLPAFETARLKLAHGANLFAGRYNIGYWPWELTSLPPTWRFAFDLVDEIWASSHFLLDVFQRLTSKPVMLMPPHVAVPEVVPFDRERFGLSTTDVIFLCMFDFNSYIARKNPAAVIEAFRLAFPSRVGDERLLIKTINGHANAEALHDLQRQVADDDRIVLIDGSFARGEVCGLVQDADCYVSLHRSEGFGRILAEAMLLGTPVIATDWSGNTSFLDSTTGFPVSCTLRGVRSDEYVYAEGSVWAEPSAEDAAQNMRRITRDPRAVAAVTAKARRTMQQHYGLAAAASRIDDWLTGFAARTRQL